MIGLAAAVLLPLVPFWLIWAFAAARTMLGGLASAARGRSLVLRSACISSRTSRPLARRRGRGDLLDGGARRLPARLAARSHLDRNRCRRRNGSVAESADSLPRHGVPRLAALADPVAVRLRLGHAAVPRLLDALGCGRCRCPTCTTSFQDAAGCRRESQRGRDLSLNLLSATGTGILLSAIVGGLILGFSPLKLLREYGRTLGSCATP